MRPFDRRVLEANEKFLPESFKSLVKQTAESILKRNEALGLTYSPHKPKVEKMKRLKR